MINTQETIRYRYRYWCADGCGRHFDADYSYSLVVNCIYCGSYKTRVHIEPLCIPYVPVWWQLQREIEQLQREIEQPEMLYADLDWRSKG